MSYCTSCGELLNIDEARSFAGELYCESCFEDQFTYCNDCDSLISREYASFDDDGDPYCDECYNNRFDEDCPDNPFVDDADRDLIVKLARNWLFNGKNKLPISINAGDEYLPHIREQVGLVENPIYLYGLLDRSEYEILVSEDIKPKVESFISEYLPVISDIYNSELTTIKIPKKNRNFNHPKIKTIEKMDGNGQSSEETNEANPKRKNKSHGVIKSRDG